MLIYRLISGNQLISLRSWHICWTHQQFDLDQLKAWTHQQFDFDQLQPYWIPFGYSIIIILKNSELKIDELKYSSITRVGLIALDNKWSTLDEPKAGVLGLPFVIANGVSLCCWPPAPCDVNVSFS